MSQNTLAHTFPRELRLLVIAALLAGLANLAAPPPAARAATIIVDTTLDTIDANGGVCVGMVIADLPGGDGVISLREAICASNGEPVGAPHTIDFNIGGGGVQTISPNSALPAITRPVTIDGTTQPGFAGTPIIELNGAGAGAGVNGLTISAGSSTVRGLVINRFGGSGITLNTNGGNLIESNYIGTDVTGATALSNSLDGVRIEDAPNNTIGGAVAGAGNVISGNGLNGVVIVGNAATGNVVQDNHIGADVTGTVGLGNTQNGVLINAPNNTIGGAMAGAGNVISDNGLNGVVIIGNTATGNVVRGNYIGTDVTGAADLGNTQSGVTIIGAPNNTIGDTATGAGNVISGNGTGVIISNNAATGNVVQGNYIGTDVTGTADLGNGYGLRIEGAPNNTIGGAVAGAGNVISGNNGDGVFIHVNTATGNLVQGNHIGTDVTGTVGLGNDTNGVSIDDAANNTIGGVMAGAGNIIASNGGDGVSIQSGAGNGVLSNPIFSNGGLGIDLDSDGVTANDAGDGDIGANDLQNFPVLTSAISDGGSMTIQGTLNSLASTAFRIEFFANAACDSTGYGEGETYLGSTDVNTNGAGNVSFASNFAVAVTGGFVTATATDPANNTSEFSACLPVLSPTPVPAPPSGGGDKDDDDDDEPAPTSIPPPQVQEFDCWPWLVIVPPLTIPNAGTICQPSLGTPLPAASTFPYLGHSTDVTIEDAAGMPVTQFSPPLKICFRYKQPQLDAVGGDPADFLIQTFHNEAWESLTTNPEDDPSPSVLGRVCAPADHLTLFALFARDETALVEVASADNSLAQVEYLPETGLQGGTHWPRVVLGVIVIVVIGGTILIQKYRKL